LKKSFAIILGILSLAVVQPSFAQTEPSGFTNPINISNNTGNSTNPQMVFSGNSVYVTWLNTVSGTPSIFFTKSTDGGSSFGKPIDLGMASSGDYGLPSISHQGSNVYIAWQGFVSGNPIIYFSKSSDDGVTFEKPLILSDKSKNSAFPQIVSSTNHVYVTWIEKAEDDSTNIVFTKSDDSGNSFVAPMSITSSKGNVGIPKLASDGNNVYLLWEDNSKGGYEIMLARSTDSGSTFATPVNISNNSGSSGAPQLVVMKNKIYVVWMDDTSKNYEIYFAKSDDSGVSFSKPLDVSNTSGDSGYAQLDVSGVNVYVVWTETISNTNYDIMFAKSSNDGTSFEKPVNLSKSTGASGWPQIMAENNDIYVSWVDNTPGNFDIYITKSPDGGTTFVKPIDVSNTKDESYYNQMAITPSAAYMVWQEANQGNHDIMFVKSAIFVPEFGSIASIVLTISVFTIVIMSARARLRL
jgi:predicted secreted protein with PEFG-CTERM motif